MHHQLHNLSFQLIQRTELKILLISSLVFLNDLFSNELENRIYIEITKINITHLLFSIITMTATKKVK